MILRNILSNWVALLVTGGVSIALTPLLVHGLGHFHYGLWVLVGSLVDYFGLLDGGIRTTLQRFVARLRASDDRRALNETFTTGAALTLAICIVILGATAALAFLPPHVFGLDDSTQWLFSWLVILLGASAGIAVHARFVGAYLCGFQRFDLYNLAAIAFTLVRATIIVLALAMGMGTVWVGIATLAGTILMWALHWHFVRRVDPDLQLTLGGVRAERARELVSFSAYVCLTSAGEYVRAQSGTVIIARVLGLAMITPFNIAARLVDHLRAMVFGVITPLMPWMSALDGQRLQADLKELVLRAVRLTTLLVSFVAWMLVLNGDELIRLWLGPGFEISVNLMLILLVGFVVAQVQSPIGALLFACGRHRVYAWWTVGEAVGTVLLSIYWAPVYGLPGVALAMTVSRTVVKTTIQPWYTLRVLGVSLNEYIRRAFLRPLAVNTIFLAVCLITNAFAPTTGFPDFLWAATWETALFGCLGYALGFTPASRQLARERARRMVRRAAVPADLRPAQGEPLPGRLGERS